MASRYGIDQTTVLGIDIGLSSCGLAYITPQRIEYLGVRLFESAEDPYTQQPKQSNGRMQRAQRVRLKRCSQRRAALRELLSANEMWPDETARAGLNPYQLRAEALDRLLTPEEFGAAIFHAVRRRGYVPRGDLGPAASSGFAVDQVASGPIAVTAAWNEMRASPYRTAGEMLAKDPFFHMRKRNRPGDYRAAFSRPMVEQEIVRMFEAQRGFRSHVAGQDMQQAIEDLAFAQLPRRYPAKNRPCPFLPSERLGARRAPTMERCIFLDRLTKLRLADAGVIRRLSPLELSRAAERFGRTISVTRLDLRRWLALGPQVRFIDNRSDDTDLISYKGAAYGTVTLRNILGRAVWNEISEEPRIADSIAAAVTFANDALQLAQQLAHVQLPESALAALQEAFDDGELDGFCGVGRVSIAAAGRMTPFLIEGHLAFDAAIKAGFDPLVRDQSILHAVSSPRVVKPVLEAMKQVYALIVEVGCLPGRIHVEVTHDPG